MHRCFALAACAAVLALAVAGCGGSSDNKTTSVADTPATVNTKKDFVTRADLLCIQFNNQASQLRPAGNLYAKKVDVNTVKRADQLMSFFQTQFPVLAARIREIGAPPADKAKVAGLLTALENQAPEFLTARNAMLAKEPGWQKKVRAAYAHARSTSRKWVAYGFKVCP